MVASVRLLLVQLKAKNTQLYQQNYWIYALTPSTLQQVLVPIIDLVAACYQIVGKETDAEDYIGQNEEDAHFGEIVCMQI